MAGVSAPGFSWGEIARLGLVQTALGAVVVLITSTINRVMVVELALPALVPGALLGLHYAVQVLRPRWGYGSDRQGRRTPWIVGGMAALCLGGFGAACATALAETHLSAGMMLAVAAFLLVGMGAGAAGTSLLVLLAGGVAEARRGAAATIVWVMMIAGFAVTAPLAGHFLDPFSGTRLMAVSGTVSALAFLVAGLAVAGVEGRAGPAAQAPAQKAPFSAQELILEPYAGLVFAMSPGATTKLAGLQHGGVLAGMLAVAAVTAGIGGPVLGSLRLWTVAGCLGSAAALLAIALGPALGAAFPMRAAVFALGVCNGVYAVAAIGSMMGLAGAGGAAERGTRMGVWGAAQGVAFGAGGVLGTLAVDLARLVTAEPARAYAAVFAAEAGLFVLSALIAARLAPAAGGGALARTARFSLGPELEAR